MNIIAAIAAIVPLLQLIPQIMTAWNSSPTKGLQAVGNVIKNTPAVSVLEQIGAEEFPKLAPELHAAAGALLAAFQLHTQSTTVWIQGALNEIESTGYISFGPALKVDGIYGPKTKAAIVALQAKLGLPTNGLMADIEYNAITALLAKV